MKGEAPSKFPVWGREIPGWVAQRGSLSQQDQRNTPQIRRFSRRTHDRDARKMDEGGPWRFAAQLQFCPPCSSSLKLVRESFPREQILVWSCAGDEAGNDSSGLLLFQLFVVFFSSKSQT